MPFLEILSASLVLSGVDVESLAGPMRPNMNDLMSNELASRVCSELIVGAKLGKIAATRGARGDIGYLSVVDLEDARSFLEGRGILQGELGKKNKGRRDGQYKLLKDTARKLGIDIKKPKLGDKAALRDALVPAYPHLFTKKNWAYIWREAIRAEVVNPIKVAR